LIEKLLLKYRDRSLAEKLTKYINGRCDGRKYLIMHVCGTQPE